MKEENQYHGKVINPEWGVIRNEHRIVGRGAFFIGIKEGRLGAGYVPNRQDIREWQIGPIEILLRRYGHRRTPGYYTEYNSSKPQHPDDQILSPPWKVNVEIKVPSDEELLKLLDDSGLKLIGPEYTKKKGAVLRKGNDYECEFAGGVQCGTNTVSDYFTLKPKTCHSEKNSNLYSQRKGLWFDGRRFEILDD